MNTKLQPLDKQATQLPISIRPLKINEVTLPDGTQKQTIKVVKQSSFKSRNSQDSPKRNMRNPRAKLSFDSPAKVGG